MTNKTELKLSHIKDALNLLNAMVLCGEPHSDKSIEALEKAGQTLSEWNKPRPEPCVEVKPLEWYDRKDGSSSCRGRYEITDTGGKHSPWVLTRASYPNPCYVMNGNSVEGLKKQAQIDHNSRLLSAITTRTVDDVKREAHNAALDKAAKYLDEMRVSCRSAAINAINAMKEGE